VILLTAIGEAAQPATLACPPGMERQSHKPDDKSLTAQWCRDPKTGLREGPMRILRDNGSVEADAQYRDGKLEGPYRIYGADGQVALITTYAKGIKLEERMTRAGFETIIREQNAQAEKDGKNWRMALVDDHTARYTVRVSAPFSWFTDAQETRARLLADPRLCALFGIPAGLHTVIARYENGRGEELATIPLTRADCARTRERAE
jgi:hypothetical protein